MLFDHRDAGVVQRRHQPDRNVSQQHADDAGVSQAVHRHLGRIEPDGGDDLVDLAMIALAGIVAPGPAVALQQQRRIVGSAASRRFQFGCQLHGDRNAVALGLFLRCGFCRRPWPTSASSISAAPDDHADPRRAAATAWLGRAPVIASVSVSSPN